jgi:hypothetical protein
MKMTQTERFMRFIGEKLSTEQLLLEDAEVLIRIENNSLAVSQKYRNLCADRSESTPARNHATQDTQDIQDSHDKQRNTKGRMKSDRSLGIASSVLAELRMAGRELTSILVGICKAEISAGKESTALRDELIPTYRDYEAAGDRIEFRKSPRKSLPIVPGGIANSGAGETATSPSPNTPTF